MSQKNNWTVINKDNSGTILENDFGKFYVPHSHKGEPKLKHALDKVDYVKRHNSKYKHEILEVKDERRIIVYTKYGPCKVTLQQIVDNFEPSIFQAVDKVSYWRNCAHDLVGYNYDYTKSRYTGMDKLLKVSCQYHGDFKKSPLELLQGRICPLCRPNDQTFKVWMSESTNKSRHFYIYKKGVSLITDVVLELTDDILYHFSSEDPRIIWDMQHNFNRQFEGKGIDLGPKYVNIALEPGNVVSYKEELYVVVGKPPKWRDQEPYTFIQNKPERDNINCNREGAILEKLTTSPFERGRKYVKYLPKFHSKGLITIKDPEYNAPENDDW